MRCYKLAGGKITTQTSLWDAFDLSADRDRVVSIVGGGGKTSLMYQMAEEAAGMGKRVIVTTSTHIFYPQGYQVLVTERAEDVKDVVWENQILVVGVRVSEEKLKGMAESEIGKLKEFADVVLIEADGAKRLPVKVPGEHEPVVISETEAVIACVGLDCLGRPFREVCFRYELAEEWLHVEADTLVDAGHVAELVCSGNGGRKEVQGREFRVMLGKEDTVDADTVRTVLEMMEARGVRCVASSFRA